MANTFILKNEPEFLSQLHHDKGVVEIGDIVQLRSGGPNMTVANNTNGALDCWWFDSQTRICKSIFLAEVLFIVDKPGRTSWRPQEMCDNCFNKAEDEKMQIELHAGAMRR